VLGANLSVAGRQSIKSQNSTKMTRKGRILRFSVLFYGAFGILYWFWLTNDEDLLAAWSSVDFSGNLRVKAVSASILSMIAPISFLLSYIEERVWVFVAALLY
jgi:cellobiose-specific phosphotransferase system component IIC